MGVSFFARRYDNDWLKIAAMRIDAARMPMNMLRRNLWLTRFEYWYRKFANMRPMYRSAKVEWVYIKGRLSMPYTWTGRDLVHAAFWGINVWAGWCFGEVIGRWHMWGYPVADPSWMPSRPQFAPGFYHVHGIFDDYPFEKTGSSIARWMSRGYFPNTSDIY